MTDAISIGDRRVGANEPVYIVAELSANHNGSLDTAAEIVRAAKAAGADAVKLQTYTPEAMTIDVDRPEFRISGGTAWDGRTLHDLYSEGALPRDWHERLREVAAEVGIALFSSAFSRGDIDFLESLGVEVHKVSSFELVDLELVGEMARTGKPLILSTGMATDEEIADAIAAARSSGADDILLLKCTSAYPAPIEDMNLRAIATLRERYGVPIGLSDHTLGSTASISAVTLGACLIEKHLTLDRTQPGPDSSFSLEPKEFRALVEAIRATERSLGTGEVETGASEANNRSFRRSLFVVEDIPSGAELTRENVRSIRPGHGLAPKQLPEVLGRRTTRALTRGTPLDWSMVE
jgi:pseudaminic acid synthase